MMHNSIPSSQWGLWAPSLVLRLLSNNRLAIHQVSEIPSAPATLSLQWEKRTWAEKMDLPKRRGKKTLPPSSHHSQRVYNDLLLFHAYETWYWKEGLVLCQAARQLITPAHTAGPWELGEQDAPKCSLEASLFSLLFCCGKYLSRLFLSETSLSLVPFSHPLGTPSAPD